MEGQYRIVAEDNHCIDLEPGSHHRPQVLLKAIAVIGTNFAFLLLKVEWQEWPNSDWPASRGDWQQYIDCTEKSITTIQRLCFAEFDELKRLLESMRPSYQEWLFFQQRKESLKVGISRTKCIHDQLNIRHATARAAALMDQPDCEETILHCEDCNLHFSAADQALLEQIGEDDIYATCPLCLSGDLSTLSKED